MYREGAEMNLIAATESVATNLYSNVISNQFKSPCWELENHQDLANKLHRIFSIGFKRTFCLSLMHISIYFHCELKASEMIDV